jgi:fatty-acyl-CoA synthase
VSTFNLAAVLAHHADRFPERACLVTGGAGDRTITYRDLARRSGEVAAGLRRLGVHRGDVVGVLLYNCPEFIEVMFALSRLGAIFMPINWRLAADEVSYVLTHAGARAVVSEPELAPLADAARPQLPGAAFVSLGDAPPEWTAYEALRAPDQPPAIEPVDGDDVHRLMYTSGTTARPKGVMISYANLYWKNVAHLVEFGITGQDRGLACGPLYHVGALDLTTTTVLYAGGTVEIQRKFEAEPVLDALERRRITNVWLAPSMVNQLLAHPTLPGRDLTSVRLIIDGGEKMPVPVIERLLRAFPSAWFADAYGLTETVSGDTFLDKRKTVEKIGSVGKACLHLDVAIWDEADRAVPPGTLGEIVLRGPKVFQGYWKDPAATAAAFRGGWFHTGDIGYLDDEGFLYIVDRKKDMIVSGGENVYSAEVENALARHPAVAASAVIGIPSEQWGEAVHAVVVLKQGASATAAELSAHCRGLIAGYKCPRSVEFRDALPMTGAGKIQKTELRKPYWEGRTRAVN